MHNGTAIALAVLLILITISAPVAAHSPEFPAQNESLSTATNVNDPTKSWAIYSELHTSGEAQYYMLQMHKGENISVQIIAPISSTDNGFLPSVALMGPGIENNGSVPAFVEVPSGAGIKVVHGELPTKSNYEPFTPSAYYVLGSISVDAPQDGNYYLAVFDQDSGSNYCLAVGMRESFTVQEWLVIPFSAIGIYLWEGQSLLAVLATPVATFVVGLVILLAFSRNRLQPVDTLWILASVAGLLMIASGGSVLFQMIWSLSRSGFEAAVAVTLLFAVLPVVVGFWALRIAHRRRVLNGVKWKTRLALLVIAGLSLLLWSGYLVGPALALVAAVLPGRWLLRSLS